jgi:hypothetical protein
MSAMAVEVDAVSFMVQIVRTGYGGLEEIVQEEKDHN